MKNATFSQTNWTTQDQAELDALVKPTALEGLAAVARPNENVPNRREHAKWFALNWKKHASEQCSRWAVGTRLTAHIAKGVARKPGTVIGYAEFQGLLYPLVEFDVNPLYPEEGAQRQRMLREEDFKAEAN